MKEKIGLFKGVFSILIITLILVFAYPVFAGEDSAPPEPEVVTTEDTAESESEEPPEEKTWDDEEYYDTSEGPPLSDWTDIYCPEAKPTGYERRLQQPFMVPADVVLAAGYIKNEKNFIESGYVLGDVENRHKKFSATGEDIVLSFTDSTPGISLGDSMLIYRWGKEVYDLDGTKNYLGKIVEIVGVVVINELGRESSKGLIVKSFGAVKKGDLLRPYTAVNPVKDFSGNTPNEKLGYIVGSRHNVLWPAQLQNIVFIDSGSNHGVTTGMVFTVYKLMEEIEEPDGKNTRYVYKEPIGQIYVINVEPNSATCAVLKADTEFEIGDYIKHSTEW